MKQTIRLFTTVLLVLMSLPIQAQSNHDAFYIYQNDGHFNGFFFDEVKEISYSKLDTLGIEYSDYVSQEIVTNDSTYRIMLSAIDSVGFVQPAIKINSRVRDMQAEGLTKSLLSIDGQSLRFKTYSDDDVKPGDINVGDILVNYSFNENESFSGKVTEIGTYTGLMIVNTAPIEDPREIFERFTTIEEYSATENGELVSRRIAGLPMLGLGKYAPLPQVFKDRRADHWTKDLLNFNFTAEVPFDISGLHFDLTPSIEGKLNIRAEWDLPNDFCIITTAYYGLGLGIEAEGKVEGELNPPASGLLAIPLPAAAPVFQLELLPNLFIKGEALLKFSLQTPKFRGKVWFKQGFHNFFPEMTCGGSLTSSPGNETDQEYFNQPNNMSATLTYEGSIQTGVKFPVELRTNKVLSYIFEGSIGGYLYVGPKATGSFTLDLQNVVSGDNTIYENFKDSKLSMDILAIDFEAKAKFKKFWGSEKEISYNSAISIIPKADMFLFPKFDNWQVKELRFGDSDSSTGYKTEDCVTATPSVWTCFPVDVGLASYRLNIKDEEQYENTQWAEKSYWQFQAPWMTKDNNALYYRESMFLNGGPHRIYPVFRFMGKEIRASQFYEYEAPGLYLMVGVDTLKFGEAGGTKSFDMKTNAARIETKLDFSHCTNYNFQHVGSQASLTLPPKDGILTGFAPFYLFAYDSQGQSQYKSVRIIRKPSYHIRKFEMIAEASNASGYGGFHIEADANIQLSNSNHENLIYSDTKHEGNTTETININLQLDLSNPDSISINNMSKQRITGGTITYVNEWVGDNVTVTNTCRIVITKPLYCLGSHDDRSYGYFRSGYTKYDSDLNPEDLGVEITSTRVTTSPGNVTKEDYTSNPYFLFKIINPEE